MGDFAFRSDKAQRGSKIITRDTDKGQHDSHIQVGNNANALLDTAQRVKVAKQLKVQPLPMWNK